jgi:hypothetical protein
VEAASMSNPQASSPLLIYSHGHKIQAAFSQFTLCKFKKMKKSEKLTSQTSPSPVSMQKKTGHFSGYNLNRNSTSYTGVKEIHYFVIRYYNV